MMSVPHLSVKMKTKEPLGIRREQRISIWSIMEKKKYNTEKLLLQFDETLPPRVSENSFFLLNAIHRMCSNLTLYNDELMLHTFYICNEFFMRQRTLLTAYSPILICSSWSSIYCLTNVITFKCSTFMGLWKKRGENLNLEKQCEKALKIKNKMF